MDREQSHTRRDVFAFGDVAAPKNWLLLGMLTREIREINHPDALFIAVSMLLHSSMTKIYHHLLHLNENLVLVLSHLLWQNNLYLNYSNKYSRNTLFSCLTV